MDALNGLTKEQRNAVMTALSLRSMGSSEKTIIRAFAQEGKEALIGALFTLVDAMLGDGVTANDVTPAQDAAAQKSRRGKEPTEGNA